MAPPVAVVAAPGGVPGGGGAVGGPALPQLPGRGGGGFGGFFGNLIRTAFIWWLMTSLFKKKTPGQNGPAVGPLFRKGELVDLWVYLSEDLRFTDFNDQQALIWHEAAIPLTQHPSASRNMSTVYRPSYEAQHNATVYLHVFFARNGRSPDPMDPTYDKLSVFGKSQRQTVYDKPPKNIEQVVDGSQDNETLLSTEAQEWISYWKPNITINLVDEFTSWAVGSIPAHLSDQLHIEPYSGQYFPIVYLNEFWAFKDTRIALNDTVSEVPFHLEVGIAKSWWWQLQLQLDASFKMQQSMGALGENDSDEFKRMLVESNPYLLALTMAVTLLHTVFDVLAFKNDINFWRNNKSMEGLSLRTIVINCFCQVVIFLYLLDNKTSWMIIISAGIGVLIEFWKIGKAMKVSVDRSGMFPTLKFEDRETYAGNKTKEYDQLAMKYLSWVCYPLVAGYSVYSLLYETHKSWYSWVLGTLTGSVYTFGFIMMTPQLFINYKMKSVAHLPWRQMTYKFLNTIIDDLFAFIIKMPMLHRISCFRDDVVFLIYVYQRWIYPVDAKRVNEFGFGGQEADAASQPAAIADGSAADGVDAGASASASAPSSEPKKDR
eukprot:jgi/Chlat1/9126/Chrsp97S08427